MSFTKMPKQQYEFDTSRRGWPDRYLDINKKAIAISSFQLNSPIIIFYNFIKKFSKSKDNQQKYCEGIVYDIDLNNGIPVGESELYLYKVKAYNSILSRYMDQFISQHDIFVRYENDIYFYNNRRNLYDDDKIILLFKKYVFSEDEKFKTIEKEIQYYEKSKKNIKNENLKRTPIPEDVRFEVWRRDEGKCVECGSKRNLEFDHIIPFSLGGSNTARNLQLLCEKCNRKKSNKI